MVIVIGWRNAATQYLKSSPHLSHFPTNHQIVLTEGIFSSIKQTAALDCYSINMHVDPFVKKWMDRNFKTTHGAYRISDKSWYCVVSGLLCQSSRVASPTVIPDKYSRFVNVRVCITEFDFYHYGWEVSVMQELRFSRLVRERLIDVCLHNVAMLRARYDIPVSQAINTYCVYYGLEEEDVRFETLRKEYRRKYQEIEEDYRALDRAAVTDFGLNDTEIRRRILHIRSQKGMDPNQLSLFN